MLKRTPRQGSRVHLDDLALSGVASGEFSKRTSLWRSLMLPSSLLIECWSLSTTEDVEFEGSVAILVAFPPLDVTADVVSRSAVKANFASCKVSARLVCLSSSGDS